MKEKIDFQTLRLLPYVIFSTVFCIIISMLFPIIQLFLTRSPDDVAMYEMNTSLYMLCYFFIFMSIVGILSCLYHLSMINKWFAASCNMTGAYIIAEAVVYVMKWISSFDGIPKGFDIALMIVRVIPTLSLMMMLALILHGASVVYEELGKKKKRLSCLRTVVYLVAAFSTQIMLNIFMNTEKNTDKSSLVLNVITVIIYVFNIAVMAVLYIRVKTFSYDYYIHSYNSQL